MQTFNVFYNTILVNLAFRRPTFQNGILFKNTSGFAVDNNLKTCATVRSHIEQFAWWRVVLDDSYYITDVNVYFARNYTGWLILFLGFDSIKIINPHFFIRKFLSLLVLYAHQFINLVHRFLGIKYYNVAIYISNDGTYFEDRKCGDSSDEIDESMSSSVLFYL